MWPRAFEPAKSLWQTNQQAARESRCLMRIAMKALPQLKSAPARVAHSACATLACVPLRNCTWPAGRLPLSAVARQLRTLHSCPRQLTRKTVAIVGLLAPRRADSRAPSRSFVKCKSRLESTPICNVIKLKNFNDKLHAYDNKIKILGENSKMSLTGSDATAAAATSELAERPLASGISQDALEAICSEFGEDKSTLVELYQAARDENELLEFKNYELQFKIQELEFRQKGVGSPASKTSKAKTCDRERATANPAPQRQQQDKQEAAATSGTPTTNSQPEKPRLAGAAERVSAPKRSDNNGQREQQRIGQPAAAAKSTSVNFEHENDDLNNAPNESGNKQLALSRIVEPSAGEPQRREPVTSERANDENIESGPGAAAASSSPPLAAAAADQTKNGISFARSTAAAAANTTIVASCRANQQQAPTGRSQVAGADANERGQSPEDAAAGADFCGSALTGNKVEQTETGERETNNDISITSGRPQTNEAPDCGASWPPQPADQWPGRQIEYNEQQSARTCSREQQPPDGKHTGSARGESVAPTSGQVSLAKTDLVSSSVGQMKQSASGGPPTKSTGMARIAMPVQRVQLSGGAKSNTANRGARNRAHSITSGGRRSSSATVRPTAAANKSAPAASATTRTNPMRVRSKSSLDQRTLGGNTNQPRQRAGSSSSSCSGAASISSHLPRRLGGSSLQLHQQQQQQPAVPRLISRSVSASRVCTNTGSSSPLANGHRWPSSVIRRSLAGSFVTSASQIPTLIDQSHATAHTGARLGRSARAGGAGSARPLGVASSQSSLLMGAAAAAAAADDEQNQLSKSLSNLLRPLVSVAPEASNGGQQVVAGPQEPSRELSKSCVQVNEIDVSSSSSARQLVPENSAHEETINQAKSASPVEMNQCNRLGANDAEKRACLQCKLLESKLDLLGRERALLSEQLSELEEMENDSRLASQKLAAQVGALEQQLGQCKFELARSCESESKLRFQNKRLHFELRQQHECVQSLQQQLNELRSRACALFRLHRASKHQHQSAPADDDAAQQKTAAAEQDPPPSRRASLVVDSCASSQTYDSAYSKSSSSSSSSGSSSSSSNSEVDCCEEAEEPPPQQPGEKTGVDNQPAEETREPAKVNGESGASSSCDESEHIQEDETERRQQSAAIKLGDQEREEPGHCLALANRQQVLKKRISIARILRGIQVQHQPQPQAQLDEPGQLSIGGEQRARVEQCAQAAAVNGCQTARIARVDQQQRDELARAQLAALANQSGEQSNQTTSGQQPPPADDHRDGSSPVKQQRPPARSGSRKSPIELALEGVSELERSLAADEALKSLCQTSGAVLGSEQGDETAAQKAEGESSGAGSQVAAPPTGHTRQLIDGLKSEVSNLQMRLLQANTLNDNLILELKSQQRQQQQQHMNAMECGGGQRKGQAAADDLGKRSIALVNATGQLKEQQAGGAHKRSSVIYVNGLNASVTHHHHHYEPPVPPTRPHQLAVDFSGVATTAAATRLANNQATYCHNCCRTNRQQFHAAAPAGGHPGDDRFEQQQQQSHRHSTGTFGQYQQCERELADFLKFLQEKLHFHHGRTFELVNECQKLAMNALLASYNQRVGLAHHQRVVLMGNQAAAAAQQQPRFIESTTTSELPPPVRPPPRRRTRTMLVGQQPGLQSQQPPMDFVVVGQPAAAADASRSSMTRADRNNNNTSFSPAAAKATASALQVAKQTLFSLVPIYYSSSSSSCNKQQPGGNNKEEATMKSSQAGGSASEWTNTRGYIQLASDQSNSVAAAPLQVIDNAGQQQQQQQRGHWIANDQYRWQARPAATQVQINGTNDIYATVSRTPGHGARQANRVSILKISGRDDLAQAAMRGTNVQVASVGSPRQLAQGDTRSHNQLPLRATDHHRSSCGAGGQQQQQQRDSETINQAPPPPQQQQQPRPGQLLASVKDSLSEEIERFRVHANGQLLDLLTRQNWCESLVTDKLRAIEMRQVQQANRLTSHASVSAGVVQASKSISLQLQTANSDVRRLDSPASRNQDATPAVSNSANMHMLERSTLFCNGVRMTQSVGTTAATATSRPSSINVPTKTISQSVNLNGVPVRPQELQQQVYGISGPDCSVTNSLC